MKPTLESDYQEIKNLMAELTPLGKGRKISQLAILAKVKNKDRLLCWAVVAALSGLFLLNVLSWNSFWEGFFFQNTLERLENGEPKRPLEFFGRIVGVIFLIVIAVIPYVYLIVKCDRDPFTFRLLKHFYIMGGVATIYWLVILPFLYPLSYVYGLIPTVVYLVSNHEKK